MSDDFECPHCEAAVDIGNHPDYLIDLGPSRRFTFECACGSTFEVFVEFEPVFYVEDETLVGPPRMTPTATPSTTTDAQRPKENCDG